MMYSELIRCDSRTLLIFAIACRNVLPFTVAVLVEREVEKQHSCKRGQQSFLEFCCMCVSFAPSAIYRTSDAFQCLIVFSPCMRFGSIPPSQDPPGTWSPYLNPKMAHILGRRNREREFTFPICSAQNVRHFWVHVWGPKTGSRVGPGRVRWTTRYRPNIAHAVGLSRRLHCRTPYSFQGVISCIGIACCGQHPPRFLPCSRVETWAALVREGMIRCCSVVVAGSLILLRG